ncbi:uncharacterized protein PV07_11599 [Cladophialophora immunda]|uniref:Uncharacterized protein n=1 Tax=Cladophialophora immunda TaxID=569365 RepID=A0A0D2BWF7_9EURO|nr:uncharacterized protein PV07_11599 [Cladophialophora immunda]KIW23398.1 hypothetical protein PV07_11599 [Cladophialophora immunda]
MDNLRDHGDPPSNESASDSEKEHEVASDQNVDSLVTDFVQAHERPTTSASKSPASAPRLPYPVVIPQRRPGNKQRGFVEAYAPALGQYDIDQDTFLEFIRAMNKAIKQNAWLAAIQLAAVGASFVPNGIAAGVSLAVQFVAGAIAQAEAKWRTNSFLDRMNREFFRPRGLFCLLMSYNPITMAPKSAGDDPDAVSKALLSSSSTSKQTLTARTKKNLRNPVAATAEGEDSLPTSTAPLIYPETIGVDRPRSPGEPEQKQKLGARLNQYFDKRAQARYAKESNGDILSNPEPVQFKNKYLDPNSAASNGGLLGLVSGGRLTRDPEKVKQSTQAAMASQEQAIREQQSAMMVAMQQQLQAMNLPPEQQQEYLKQYQDLYSLQLQQIQQQSDLVEKGQWQRRIVRDILYLMIVDMPSDAEMAVARGQLNSAGQVQPTDDVRFTAVDI